MPLDPEPTATGNVQLAVFAGDEVAVVVGPADAAAAQIDGIPLYISHFATCPFAASHRKPKAAA